MDAPFSARRLAHARRLRVPYGWRLVDRRGNDTVAVPAPAAG